MNRTVWITGLLAFATTMTPPTLAETAAEKGLTIAQEADQRGAGWADSQVSLRMTLINAAGQTTEREMRMQALEVSGDGDKSLVIFDTPKDVRGTALLSHAHTVGADDQWLYLPALKRTKRISSRNKSGPFMGSEFSYEDMSAQEVDKYTYKYLRNEPCGDWECFVIERYPTDKTSGYSKQISWIDTNEYRLQKVDFYDRKKSLLKTLSFHDYQQYNNRFWRANQMQMVNHQNNKQTQLTYNDYRFAQGLTDADFNKRVLTRIR